MQEFPSRRQQAETQPYKRPGSHRQVRGQNTASWETGSLGKHPAAGRAHLASRRGCSSLRMEAQGQDTHPPRVWGDPSTSYGSEEHEGATRIKGKNSDLLLGMWIQAWVHGRRTMSRLPWAESILRLNY